MIIWPPRTISFAPSRIVFQNGNAETQRQLPKSPDKPADQEPQKTDLLAKTGTIDFNKVSDLIDQADQESVKKITDQTKLLLNTLTGTLESLKNNTVKTDFEKKLIPAIRGNVDQIVSECRLDKDKVGKSDLQSVLADLGKSFKKINFDQNTGHLNITGFMAKATIEGKHVAGIYKQGERSRVISYNATNSDINAPGSTPSGEDSDLIIADVDTSTNSTNLSVRQKIPGTPVQIGVSEGTYRTGVNLSTDINGVNLRGGIYRDAGTNVGVTVPVGSRGHTLSYDAFGPQPVDLAAGASPADISHYVTIGLPPVMGLQSVNVSMHYGPQNTIPRPPGLARMELPEEAAPREGGVSVGGSF